MAASSEICRYLSWDSEFFGVRIGSVLPHRLDAAAVAAIRAFRREHRIDCLYFLADLADAETIRRAEDEGFRMVDLRMTLERRGAPSAASPGEILIRPAEERDLPILKALARENHVDSRFYYDPHFPRERCDALYEAWIENDVHGRADRVLVPEVDGKAAGYITCHREGPPRIGLLGVGPAAQGKGLGGRLIREALAWFAAEGSERVSVVTQGRNVRAQRAYQREGFTTAAVEAWYHGWTGQALAPGLPQMGQDSPQAGRPPSPRGRHSPRTGRAISLPFAACDTRPPAVSNPTGDTQCRDSPTQSCSALHREGRK